MADPVAQQAAINEMFRQAFSPVAQYGAGRLALAREAEARRYAETQRQRQRADALTDLQAQLAIREPYQERADTRTAERQLEYLRQQMDLAQKNGDYAAYRNYALQAMALESRQLEGARTQAAELGLNIDEDKFAQPRDYIAEVQKQAQARSRSNRGVATQANRRIGELDRQVSDLEAQMEAVALQADLTPEEELTIAKRALLGLATGDKERANFQKLGTLDAVYAAAATADPTGQAVDRALTASRLLKQDAARLKLSTLQRRADGLLRARSAADRNLTSLAQRGIFPDLEEPTAPDSRGTAEDLGLPTGAAGSAAPAAAPAATAPRLPNLTTFRTPAAPAQPAYPLSVGEALRLEGVIPALRPNSLTQAAIAARLSPALRTANTVNAELGAMVGPSAGARLADSAGRFLFGGAYNPAPPVAIEDVIGQMGQDAWGWLTAPAANYVPVGGDDGRAAREQAATLGIDPRAGVVPGYGWAVAPRP